MCPEWVTGPLALTPLLETTMEKNHISSGCWFPKGPHSCVLCGGSTHPTEGQTRIRVTGLPPQVPRYLMILCVSLPCHLRSPTSKNIIAKQNVIPQIPCWAPVFQAHSSCREGVERDLGPAPSPAGFWEQQTGRLRTTEIQSCSSGEVWNQGVGRASLPPGTPGKKDLFQASLKLLAVPLQQQNSNH